MEPKTKPKYLLQRHKTGRLSGTNTSGTMLDRLVGDGEFAKVVSDHVSLDLHLVEHLAIVHTNNRSNHLGENDHVAQVSLDALGLLALSSVACLLCSAEALEEGVVLTLQTMLEAATGTSVDKVHELSHGHDQ